VLQNLVDNAAKFMGEEPQPRIEIGMRLDGDERVFFVKDNGRGIEPRFRDRVFGLFEKLDPDSEGSGVGLALVKRIVDLHRGRVWVESEGAGRGTTACFTLPDAP
jgi:signal transduction histidine kinase